MKNRQKFHSTVILGGKTATGIEVPGDVVEKLAAGKRPPVTVTIHGRCYRTTIAPMGGKYYVPLSAENRELTKVAAGDKVEVGIELDDQPREVTVPADLAAILKKTPGTRKYFDSLSYTRRKEYVRAIEEAKTTETRQRRIDKAMSELQGAAQSK